MVSRILFILVLFTISNGLNAQSESITSQEETKITTRVNEQRNDVNPIAIKVVSHNEVNNKFINYKTSKASLQPSGISPSVVEVKTRDEINDETIVRKTSNTRMEPSGNIPSVVMKDSKGKGKNNDD